MDEVVLIEVSRYDKRYEAEMYEAYLILSDYFGDKNLINDLPKRIKYF